MYQIVNCFYPHLNQEDKETLTKRIEHNNKLNQKLLEWADYLNLERRYIKKTAINWPEHYYYELQDIGAIKYINNRWVIKDFAALSDETINKLLGFNYTDMIKSDKIKYAERYDYEYISVRRIKHLFKMTDEHIKEMKDKKILIYKSPKDNHLYLTSINAFYDFITRHNLK